MVNADANRASLAYWEETTFGTAPSSNPTFEEINFTSESLGADTATALSQTIRSDRQAPSIARTGFSASGDISFELQGGGYDDFFQAVLQSSSALGSETTVISAASTVSFASAGTITTSGSWASTPNTGDMIVVSGASTSGNNRYYKVVSATSTVITVSPAPSTESAGSSVTISAGSKITNGTTAKSFTIEREYTDLTNTFASYTGVSLDGMSLTVPPDGIITGSFACIGKDETSGTSTLGDGSNTAAATTQVMSGVNDVNTILVGGADFTATGASFSLSNNLRARQVVGTLGTESVGSGVVSITGSVSAYFSSAAIFNTYLNFTASSLVIVTEDSAGNGYVFDIPNIRFTGGRRVAGGQSTDIIGELQFSAIRQSLTDSTIAIHKFSA